MNAPHSFRPLRLIVFLTGILTLLIVTGCHTANGFGKDVERAGEKIQDGTK